MSAKPPYVELRTRSAFSFLEGASAPEDLVDNAAALGYDAIGLGDRDGVYAAPRFYQAASRAGVKAIVGADLTLEDHLRLTLIRRRNEDQQTIAGARLYLIAPDRERYRNLCRMITASKLRVIGENSD